MVISVLFLLLIIIQLSKTVSVNRRILALVAIVTYFAITIFDLYWLETVEGVSFHFSDPGLYYNHVLGLSFIEVLSIESSNSFYFIMNWFYYIVWDNPMLISLLVKINNVLLTVLIYLIATKKREKVNSIDFLILFSPYTIMTLIRNVRDMYIVLFVLVILIGLGAIKGNHINKIWVWASVLLLSITRSVLLGPLMVIYWIKYKHLFSKRTQTFFYMFVIAMLFIFNGAIIGRLGGQMISVLSFNGEFNPDLDFLRPLLQGGLSLSIVMFLVSRLFVGTISFFFTPHPINFWSSWMDSMGSTGSSGIYTGIDNALIMMGSVFNYLFVIPLIIAFWINYKKVNRYILIFIIGYSLLYIVAYLGVTDIRNRNTLIFFLLLGLLFSKEPIKINKWHYMITFVIFIGLYIISN